MRTEFEEGPEDEKEPPLYLYELEFLVGLAITIAISRLLYLGDLRADGPNNAVHAILRVVAEPTRNKVFFA